MSSRRAPPPVHVRPANSADIDALCAFNAAMALETEGRELDSETLRTGVGKGLADPSRARYFVAERGAAVVGCLMLTQEWSDWRAGFWWWIQSVYVLPDQRRTNVYRTLHAHVLELARSDAEVIGLRLYVERGNSGAQRTYLAQGMVDAHYCVFEQVGNRATLGAPESGRNVT